MSESRLETQLGESLALVKRVKALEKQCAVLSAEIDRQRLVVTAACQWHIMSKYGPEHYLDHEQDLANAVATYEASAPMTTTTDNNCCHFQD